MNTFDAVNCILMQISRAILCFRHGMLLCLAYTHDVTRLKQLMDSSGFEADFIPATMLARRIVGIMAHWREYMHE